MRPRIESEAAKFGVTLPVDGGAMIFASPIEPSPFWLSRQPRDRKLERARVLAFRFVGVQDRPVRGHRCLHSG